MVERVSYRGEKTMAKESRAHLYCRPRRYCHEIGNIEKKYKEPPVSFFSIVMKFQYLRFKYITYDAASEASVRVYTLMRFSLVILLR